MIYQFADLELNTGRHQLTRDGQNIKLTRLTFRVLEVLVEAAPNLVTHDELVDRAWGPKRVISPENISQRIMMLRQSLGDNADHPTYIEGLRGEGFRLIPEVRKTMPAEGGPASAEAALDKPGKPARKRWWLTAGLALLLVSAGIAATLLLKEGGQYARRPLESSSSIQRDSVAVLPFVNLSPNPEHAFYAAGIHEEILNQLVKQTSLKVISRTSMARFQDTREPIPNIARELDVDSVLEGSVRYSNDRIRVTIQLVDGKSDIHLWSDTYDRELKDIFAIESDIARNVAAVLTQITDEEASPGGAGHTTTNLAAYELYMQGMQEARLRQPDQLANALAHFREATELDPQYLPAWVAVADSLHLLVAYGDQRMRETFAERQEAINRALEIDATSGEAWLSLAQLRVDQGMFEQAEEYFTRSISLAPGYGQAHHWYALHLLRSGRAEEALPPIRKAIELDPLSPTVNGVLAQILRQVGRVEEALAVQRKLISLEPEYVPNYVGLGNDLAQLGKLDAAAYWTASAATLSPENLGIRGSECFRHLSLGMIQSARECRELLKSDFPDTPGIDVWPEMRHFHGEYATLVDELEAWMARAPEPGPIYQLAYAHLLNGDIARARELFSKILPTFMGDEPVTLTSFNLWPATLSGVVLYHSGEIERANYLFDEVLQLIKTMHRTRGSGYGGNDIVIHMTRGDNSRAIAALRDAIDSGWRLGWWRLRGPGFEAVEQEPEWQALIAELEADIDGQRSNFLAHQDDPDYWR